MDKTDNDDLVERLKEVFSSLVPAGSFPEYPKEALEMGTLIRSTTYNRLGVVADAFYGDVDEVGTKIIIYTLFLLPKRKLISTISSDKDKYFLTNEYEYNVVAYIMMNPVPMSNLKSLLGGIPL
jgi:hypothetical protein